MRWAGHVGKMEEGRSSFKILTSTPAGKRYLGRHGRGLEDNIRVDLEEMSILKTPKNTSKTTIEKLTHLKRLKY